jgi:hypothetical protein
MQHPSSFCAMITFIIATDSARVIALTPLKVSELSKLNLTFGLNA